MASRHFVRLAWPVQGVDSDALLRFAGLSEGLGIGLKQVSD